MCGPRPSCKRPLALHGRAGMPGPYYIQNSRPGFPQTRAALLIKYYAFLIFSFAAAASSRRRSMAVRVAASVSA